jgi:hypothetical protein
MPLLHAADKKAGFAFESGLLSRTDPSSLATLHGPQPKILTERRYVLGRKDHSCLNAPINALAFGSFNLDLGAKE